jgi:hypothetical protein
LVGWNDAELGLFSRLNCPAPEELTSFGKIPFCTDRHIIGLKVLTVVERTIDAKTKNAGAPHDLYKTAR